ncbi:hypothetical protein QCA50_019566 [Cerrena zonata]|uniref:F-box domain-containing protein n=1 Tax=Cerrena zonata TaxID=2478898 RepID=A0AAW0F979_9APHY
MSSRRSQRIAATKTADSEGYADPNIDIEHLIEEPRASSSSQKRRRVQKKTQSTNGRGQGSGKLKAIMDMPFDIFLEITSWLHPLDLIQLSRVSKQLRGIFISKSSRTLWVRARRDTRLPDCPDGLNELQYATLVFDELCQACSKPRSKNVEYVYKLRLCTACYKKNVVEGEKLFKQYPKYLDPIIFNLLPRATEEPNSEAYYPAENGPSDRYYKPRFDAIARRLLSFEKGSPVYKAFIEDMKKACDSMILFNDTMWKWYTKETADMIRNREPIIMEKLLAMDLTEADLPSIHHRGWISLAYTPRPLTEIDWKEIVNFVMTRKAIRSREDFRKRFDKLEYALGNYYISNYCGSKRLGLDSNDDPWRLWAPDADQAVKIPEVIEYLCEDEARHKPDVLGCCVDLIEEYALLNKDVVDKELLPQLEPLYSADDSPVILDSGYLLRASTIFRYPSRPTNEEIKVYHYKDVIDKHYRFRFRGIRTPSSPPDPEIDIEASILARKVIHMLGLQDGTLSGDAPIRRRRYICQCDKRPRQFLTLVAHIIANKKLEDTAKDLDPALDCSHKLQHEHDLDSLEPFVYVEQ